MKLRLTLLVLVFLFVTIAGCDIINPEEEIPAYLYIPGFTLNTNLLDEGSDSHKITEAHLFVGGQKIGIFALPATVPVLATGDQEIQVFPGIREDGLSNITDVYPYYTRYVTNIILEPAIVDTIRPVTAYADNVNFLFAPQEAFEDATLSFDTDLDGNLDNGMEVSTLDIFEGSGSGLIRVKKEEDQVEVGSNLFTDFPPVGTQTYLEMDYKTEVVFIVGILGYDDRGIAVYAEFEKGVNPKSSWNKIYFNFSPEMNAMRNFSPSIVEYRFAIFTNLLESDQEQADIFLDNIKLVQAR